MSEVEFVVGQRWVSNGEVELGLGLIKNADGRMIEVFFPAVGESRFYAANNAPLSRVIFSIEDEVATQAGQRFNISAVHELNGCMIYQGDTAEGEPVSIHEMDLDSQVQFNQPQDRLFAGQVDKNSQFQLRVKALVHQHRLFGSDVFGLLGPRVQLLPHQMYIAQQVTQRYAPRVLLADEVGLGKTIEAGLVIHQQLLSGLSRRVLIVVPDNLLHQWLVEMLRRFNLRFTLIDQERFAALTELDEGNPFDSAQLVLCGLNDVIAQAAMQQAIEDTNWDMLVVDEAHHLEWHETESSPQYRFIETLAAQVASLLLLTATPEQLGMESHFARLRLLDPDRYYDLAAFRGQEQQYQQISDLIELIDQTDFSFAKLNKKQQAALEQYLSADCLDALSADADESVQQTAVQELLDQHGTGRILFRNTRDVVSGFPQRQLVSYPLALPEDIAATALANETHPERIFGEHWLSADLRVNWLADWLKTHRGEKVLLICADKDAAIELETYLRLNQGVRTALFHEDMSLVNRDRAAAYFADDEEGAQILLCSEIGSEGRNFQFCHHLIMFDLPLNPDLLEQRIGRLDRIGQQHDVQVHVPYYQNSAQHVLLDWYHLGMNAFERVFAAGSLVAQQTHELLLACLEQPEDESHHQQLIQQTQACTEAALEKLSQGRNKLLERNSFQADKAAALVAELEDASRTLELADFMDDVFDTFGVEQQTHSADSIIIEPGNHMLYEQFPGLPEDGITATYQRKKALSRDDMAFLNWEHPMVIGALDLIAHSELGNSAFCTLESDQFKPGTLLMEAIFVMHTVAARSLQVSRYLPESYIRLVVDEKGRLHQDKLPETLFNQSAGRIPKATAQELIRHARSQIGTLIEQAEKQAKPIQQALIETACDKMNAQLSAEQSRLAALSEKNPNIRQQEQDYLKDKQRQLNTALQGSRLTLDALRVAIVTET